MSSPQPTSTQGSVTLDSAVRRIDSISSLPYVALRVMEVAQDPRAGAQELKKAMEVDPALSARVLRAVNSSACAVRVKITNLQHAIAYLGVKQIRNMAMTAAVSKLFRDKNTIGVYSRAALWKHMVSVGICARIIALRTGHGNCEDIFLAGLLHDIGIILEDQYLHEPFCRMIGALREDASLETVEQEILGFDHTTLGQRVATRWRFPEAIVAAIRHHHQSSRCPAEFLDVLRCVELANAICSRKGMSSVGMNLVALSPELIGALSLTKDDLVALTTDLDREVKATEDIFDIEDSVQYTATGRSPGLVHRQ